MKESTGETAGPPWHPLELILPNLARLSDEDRARYLQASKSPSRWFVALVVGISLLLTVPVLQRALWARNHPNNSSTYLLEGQPGLVPDMCFMASPVGGMLATFPNIRGRGFPRLDRPMKPIKYVTFREAQLYVTIVYFFATLFTYGFLFAPSLILATRRRRAAAGFPTQRRQRVVEAVVMLFIVALTGSVLWLSLQALWITQLYVKEPTLAYNILRYQRQGDGVWPAKAYKSPDDWPRVVDARDQQLRGLDLTQLESIPLPADFRFRALTAEDRAALTPLLTNAALRWLLELVFKSNTFSIFRYEAQIFSTAVQVIAARPAPSRGWMEARLSAEATAAGLDRQQVLRVVQQAQIDLILLGGDGRSREDWRPVEVRFLNLRGQDLAVVILFSEPDFLEMQRLLTSAANPQVDYFAYMIDRAVDRRPRLALALIDPATMETKAIQSLGFAEK